ncbi:hypothetical protein AB1Y20_004031 [Prymnesium parvum]|uniref:Uncharacterized protein n=1 Tax=Prymnesium parvum TaxID=97485 RepID=A0AB34J890_PRYPA
MVALSLSSSQPLLLPPIRLDQIDLPPRAPERIPGSKVRNHVGCQTEVSELPELRALQQKIGAVSAELERATAETQRAEQRLRHEMQAEMTLRMRLHAQKCAEKMAYLRERAESHMASIRASTKLRVTQEVREHERQLHEELAAQRARAAEVEAGRAHAEREYAAVHSLAVRYARENALLHRQIKEDAEKEKQARFRLQPLDPQHDPRALATLQLAVHVRDATIASLKAEMERLLKVIEQSDMSNNSVLEKLDKFAAEGPPTASPKKRVSADGSARKGVATPEGGSPDVVPKMPPGALPSRRKSLDGSFRKTMAMRDRGSPGGVPKMQTSESVPSLAPKLRPAASAVAMLHEDSINDAPSWDEDD